MKIARVFPTRTKATPDDELAFSGEYKLPGMFLPEVDEVHISVNFTWDKDHAEWLAEQWQRFAPVKIGGPAYEKPGGDFVPGLYLKKGNVITSRGCPNHCWFCSVWKRENGVNELPINDGWNIMDDNILATSEAHFRAVIEMLKRQPEKATFTGGLEAKIIKPWQVELLASIKPKMVYFAYDTADDYEPLVEAVRMCKEAEWLSRSTHGCYCLIGYPKDTFEKAEQRLQQVVDLGLYPFAMLYRDKHGEKDYNWGKFQRDWIRPEIIFSKAIDKGA